MIDSRGWEAAFGRALGRVGCCGATGCTTGDVVNL
jgi:hypothetical protein